jgi:hypothetical protein
MVNQYYIDAVDEDFGPFFLKFCSYFPSMQSCVSTAMNTPSLSWSARASPIRRSTIACPGEGRGRAQLRRPAAASADLQQICDGLSADKIDRLLRKWRRFLPIRSPRRIKAPAAATTCQSCKPSFL